MRDYKVTICRVGHAIVKADSEEEAKTLASGLLPEQIQWLLPEPQAPPFLVTYVELVEED